MANWYCSSVAYASVTQFAVNHTYAVGDIVRQLATPTVGQERVFRCTTLGLSAGTEGAWTLTKGGTTSQGIAVFTEITGNESFQGTSWAAPHARLENAMNTGWLAVGDTLFIDSAHTQTAAADLTLTTNGTTNALTAMWKVVSVTRPSASIPPANADIASGAAVAWTGTRSIVICNGGVGYFSGVTFTAGTGSGGTSLQFGDLSTLLLFDNCTFSIPDNQNYLSERVIPASIEELIIVLQEKFPNHIAMNPLTKREDDRR